LAGGIVGEYVLIPDHDKPGAMKMKMKRWILAMILVCAGGVAACGAEPVKPVTVTFYHTSDMHEHSAPLPRIAQLVSERKKTDPNVLLIDTGDWMNKGDLTPLKTRGEAMAAMMGAARYDAVIPGNHEFTYAAPRLIELVNKYSLPMLSANLKWSKPPKGKLPAPYRIYKLKGVTVGVIGTAPPFAAGATGPSVKILPIVKTIAPIVAEVDKKADIIVLLTHLGPPADEKIIKALPRIDILFGGHHHKKFKSLNYNKTTRTIMQHSGFFGATIGEVVIKWDGKKITERKSKLIKITPKMPNSDAVKAVLDKYAPKKKAAGLTKTSRGFTTREIKDRIRIRKQASPISVSLSAPCPVRGAGRRA
jgi:5'-nucleotidase / UDP-sugar diphosphatase